MPQKIVSVLRALNQVRCGITAATGHGATIEMFGGAAGTPQPPFYLVTWAGRRDSDPRRTGIRIRIVAVGGYRGDGQPTENALSLFDALQRFLDIHFTEQVPDKMLSVIRVGSSECVGLGVYGFYKGSLGRGPEGADYSDCP